MDGHLTATNGSNYYTVDNKNVESTNLAQTRHEQVVTAE